MASQVLSGTSNVSYTNNTGQNVRIVINFMRGYSITQNFSGTNVTLRYINLNWAGVAINAPLEAIGRNIAFYNVEYVTSNATFTSPSISTNASNALGNFVFPSDVPVNGALPTELMLAPGQTFTATCEQYNIVVIPEAG